MKGYKDDIDWNSAVADLEDISTIKRLAQEAYATYNVELYYRSVRMLFLELMSIIKFDWKAYKEKFEAIKGKIYSMDINRDGKIDEDEKFMNAQKSGKIFEELEIIYCELMEMKVTAGFSVRKADYAREIKKEEMNKARNEMPIFDV